jgi:hypothetical protein
MTHWPDLHFDYDGNSLPGDGEDLKALDPYGAEYPTEDALDGTSAWKVHNNRQCYP